MRLGFILASVTALASLPSAALAEGLAPALVRVLSAPGRVHPLADVTGRIPLSVALPPGADAAALGLLGVAKGVGAIRLLPDEVAPFAAAHPDLALGVAPRLHALLDLSGNWTRVGTFRTSTGGLDGKGVIFGIVDTGLDVSHPDFRTADGHTRVAWMLVGGPPAGLHPDLEARFGCTDPKQSACAIYAAADIDGLIKSGKAPGDPEGHGTHVASIAAGNGNGGTPAGGKPRYVGMAPEATVIVAAPMQSSGFYDTDILNGASFVFDRAAAIGAPLVMNVSLGTDYGAHDGSSNLEKGLSALVGDDQPGRAIVVAAGNSGALSDPGHGIGPYGIHTEVHVSPGEVARVPMLAGAAKSGRAFVWITFHPGDDVAVGLEGPGGATWVGLTGKGQQAGYSSGKGDSRDQAGVINNASSTTENLTAGTDSAVVVFNGHWADKSEFAVVLQGSGDASLWITGEQDAAQNLFFERSIRQGTINVPATAPGLLAVGCTVNRTSWTPLHGATVALAQLGEDMHPTADSACFFSSSGPTPAGVQKPEISAPGGLVVAAMSAAADPRQHPGGLFDFEGCPPDAPYCAVLDDYHALAEGTSMSAPHVAGAIALLMEIDPTLTQARVTEVLQAGARLSIGHIPDLNQLGPGSLDIEGARLSLLDTMAAPADPSPTKSWYTLSSAYARPDPTWPVWGTVELRKSDGTLAGGIDGSKLELSLQGGVVYQPLTRVRPGLWRFAVAGRPADAGSTVVVDVAYAGASLGARMLPVGADAWSANAPSVGALGGGCFCEAAGGRPGHGGPGPAAPALVALGMAALGARRRRNPSRGG